MTGRRRVAVTGLGVKSPAGNTVGELLGRLTEARPYYERALALLPGEPLLLIPLAQTKIDRGSDAELRSAIRDLQRASVDPEKTPPIVWRLLGTAYGKVGDMGNAALALAEVAVDAATAKPRVSSCSATMSQARLVSQKTMVSPRPSASEQPGDDLDLVHGPIHRGVDRFRSGDVQVTLPSELDVGGGEGRADRARDRTSSPHRRPCDRSRLRGAGGRRGSSTPGP